MKAKFLLFAALIMVFALGLLVACTRGVSDAQIASQVQSRIATDGNVQSKQIGVQSANGVVTLTGYVSSEAERATVANDAAQVAGVKTVVNNLQVAAPQTAQAEEPAPAPAPVRVRPVTPVRRRAEAPAPRRQTRVYDEEPPAPVAAAPMAAAPAPVAPPVPPPPRRVEVPVGSSLSVRLIEPLDSERNRVGDIFHATLNEPIMVGDEVVVPSGADVEGHVVDLKSAGHFEGQSVLALELAHLVVNGKTYQLQTDQWAKQGTSRGKRTAATVGGGAALGAIIGGIAGGGKGAAIGAAAGAGAGTGVQAATKGQQIRLPAESVLTFRLQAPLNVIPASGLDRNSGRNRVE